MRQKHLTPKTRPKSEFSETLNALEKTCAVIKKEKEKEAKKFNLQNMYADDLANEQRLEEKRITQYAEKEDLKNKIIMTMAFIPAIAAIMVPFYLADEFQFWQTIIFGWILWGLVGSKLIKMR